ncbi:ribonuclease III [Chamaesiphon sp.]|uniref:ribonuclease III n=1 Tax=Chamaesiphon sp. TaxID=2814140 RepID=UPI003593454A
MSPRRQQELVKLMSRLGLPRDTQIDWSLLDIALTHPTMGMPNYEQLEFIGDSVVRLAASEFLWETYPDKSVGDFSAVRKILVSDRILAQLADGYGFDRYLTLAASAVGDPSGRISRLADAFEAVLAALYLTTNNLTLVRPWLDPHFQQLATEILQDPARQNYKDALQEWTQANYKALPEYRVREDLLKLDRFQRFIAEVWFRDRHLGTGSGQSKKAAEQAAAKVAFTTLMEPNL